MDIRIGVGKSDFAVLRDSGSYYVDTATDILDSLRQVRHT